MKIIDPWYNSYNLLTLFHESISFLRLINPNLKEDIKNLQSFLKWYGNKVNSSTASDSKNTVEPELILEYRNELHKNNISKRMINHRLTFIYKFLNFSASKGYIDSKDLHNSVNPNMPNSDELFRNPRKKIFEEYSQYLKKTIESLK